MFQHADPVADADAESPSRAALTDNDTNDRRRQAGHLQEIGGDELRLAALLCPDAGVGAWSIDQAQDRQTELGGQPHAVERLAVPLGVGTTVETLVSFLEVVALLMADQHHAMIAQPGKSRSQGTVIPDGAIAVH